MDEREPQGRLLEKGVIVIAALGTVFRAINILVINLVRSYDAPLASFRVLINKTH